MDPDTEDRAKWTPDRVTREEEIRPLDHGEQCRMMKLEAGSLSPSTVVGVIIRLRRASRELSLLLQLLKILNALSEEKWSMG